MDLIRKYKRGKLATADIRKLNNTVICLMVLVAICSIIWSISLHVLSGNFSDGLFSAKLEFRERDFSQMDNRSREIFYHDLARVTEGVYDVDVRGEKTGKPLGTTGGDASPSGNDEPQQGESQTKKPKVYKIEHVYESKQNAPKLALLLSPDRKMPPPPTTTTDAPPKIVFNPEADRQFLSSMSIDERATHWNFGASAQFVYAFPFISEITAIIWTAMCLVFQTGTKKTWGLPKPWRIVVPSIVIFSIMSLGSLIYIILTNRYLKHLCGDLLSNLSNPSALSCGDAFALLRPFIREHRLSYDVHLELFRCSYILSMLLWVVALLVMVLRYVFAVDFQLVDIDDMFGCRPESCQPIQPVCTYNLVSQNSPQHQAQTRPRSEDDFQSAKSRLSDVVTVTPLLETVSQAHVQQQVYLPTVTKA
ncbi:uncharacterized protein LOC115621058 isoform X2 [Scaptodrosophila lebanonensis]|uniref:Uncharacterized protein LOC115621058 isoform X2 n=1 Tax=Drosophila lebanonensis TaxID=7225 RepID=A0A6J2T0M0_DROLE|nr:uncharacterized protein LOC115621058 isoform X2 [Scaptodrosophila lebanonensis]XP_030370442.1 uncharacterized protein LOC115621058 isoform X2 [Scaptodrosophila lebanonensis]